MIDSKMFQKQPKTFSYNMPKHTKKLNKKKIEVSWAFRISPIRNIDFGQFPAHKHNKIKVNKKFWDEYCDIRFKFELMQKELVDSINKR